MMYKPVGIERFLPIVLGIAEGYLGRVAIALVGDLRQKVNGIAT